VSLGDLWTEEQAARFARALAACPPLTSTECAAINSRWQNRLEEGRDLVARIRHHCEMRELERTPREEWDRLPFYRRNAEVLALLPRDILAALVPSEDRVLYGLPNIPGIEWKLASIIR
jgi:hypothetical protein